MRVLFQADMWRQEAVSLRSRVANLERLPQSSFIATLTDAATINEKMSSGDLSNPHTELQSELMSSLGRRMFERVQGRGRQRASCVAPTVVAFFGLVTHAPAPLLLP